MKKIFYFLDDDTFLVQSVEQIAGDLGLAGTGFVEVSQLETALKAGAKPDYVMIDLGLPLGDSKMVTLAETRGGTETGVAVARRLKRLLPNTKIALALGRPSVDIKNWCKANQVVYLTKPITRTQIEAFCGLRKIRAFVVHGRDLKFLSKVSASLTKANLSPKILFKQPNSGRTVIEKFEDVASDCDVAVILVTPDDVGKLGMAGGMVRARARQNVILEMGYFLGRFGRTSGRVILIESAETEIPSDIAGVVRIDGSQSQKALIADLKLELKALDF